MESNSRRTFVKNSTLGLLALSTMYLPKNENNLKCENFASLLNGGVRYIDVEQLLLKKYPELLSKISLVKVNYNQTIKLHSIAQNSFLVEVNSLKKKNNIQIEANIVSGFDVAHYSFKNYIDLLEMELIKMQDFISSKENDFCKVNLLIKSDFGRNNYFNQIHEEEEFSGLDHDGEGANETFAIFYSNKSTFNTGIQKNTFLYDEDVFSIFKTLIDSNVFSNGKIDPFKENFVKMA